MAINESLTKTYTIKQKNDEGTMVDIMKITITEPKGKVYTNIIWDSRTGLVTANINGTEERKPIPYEGNSLGKLKPGPFQAENVYAMDYNYWYY